MKKAASTLLLLILISWFLLYVMQKKDIFLQLFHIQGHQLLFLFSMLLGSHVLNGLTYRILLRPYKTFITFLEGAMISILASLLNIMTPFQGGLGFQAYYLHKVHGLSMQHFLAVTGGNWLLFYFIQGCIGFLLFFLYVDVFKDSMGLIAIFVPLVLAVFVFIIFFAPTLPEPKNRLLIKITQTFNSWDRIRKDQKTLVFFTLFGGLQTLLSGFSMLLAFSVSHINISLLDALFLSIIGSFAKLLRITPGALGVTEAFLVFAAPLVGVKPEQMLIAAIILRGGILCLAAGSAPLAWIYIRQRLSSC